MVLWIIGGLAGFLIVAAVAVKLAISANGAAVLNRVDRIIGGARDAKLMATISTGVHRKQKLMIWGPSQRDPETAPLPVMIFTHGGSWENGDPLDYGFIARAFVKEGFIVVLTGYRLGHEGRYPAMLEDTAGAIAWVHKEIADYGGDPRAIILSGHSAGAYNVMMVTLEQKWLGRHGLTSDAIAAVIALSGPYDFVPLTSDATLKAFGHVKEGEALAKTQVMTHAGLITGKPIPPLFLLHGEQDTLVKPDNSLALGEAIRDAGGGARSRIYPSLDHIGPLMALAAPWRSRREVHEEMVQYARAKAANCAAKDKTSVSVQTDSR